ncbi:hypothetical protein D3C79_646860 [compost metagenome]
MGCALGNAVHVQGRGAAVHCDDEAPVQGVDEAAKGLEQRGTVFHMRVAHDHRLAAPQWQAGQRRLVAHALGQADGVGHGAFIIGIRQVAATAHGRAQLLAVDSHHGLQAGGRVGEQVQRLGTGALHQREHRQAPLRGALSSIGMALGLAPPPDHWTKPRAAANTQACVEKPHEATSSLPGLPGTRARRPAGSRIMDCRRARPQRRARGQPCQAA